MRCVVVSILLVFIEYLRFELATDTTVSALVAMSFLYFVFRSSDHRFPYMPFGSINTILPTMTITKRLGITLTPLRLHAASTVRIPHSTNNFQNLLPTIRVTPLNLFSASTVNLHGASNSNMFRNNLQIRLSPLKSPILRQYINPFKRPGMYPSISKCNAKKCNCCNRLCSKTTITSSVNGRTFSVVNDSDLD